MHHNEHNPTDLTCPALSVMELGTGYAGNRQAIDRISFNVFRGERLAVVGPNGAGKSTLFKAIVGLMPFHRGAISIHGANCAHSHDMIGYVPQHNAIDWDFPATVEDVVMMGRVRKLGWFRMPRRRDWEAIRALLDQVGMADFAKRQIGALSGGQKRRVFIARALAQETDVLLLDEPFSGVDVAAQSEIMDVLDILKAMQITVILATHDLELAVKRFDKMLLLKQIVIAYGTPQEVFQPQHLKAAYGGHVSIMPVDEDNSGTLILADEHGCNHEILEA